MKKPVIFHPSKLIPISPKKMKGGRRIEKDEITAFWKKEEAKKIQDKKGVYIFVVRHNKGYKPWYVGQASKNFKQEILTDDKIEKYNSALAEYNKSFSPYFQFIIPETRKGKPNYKAITELEKTLTIWGKERNQFLKNIQNASDIKSFIIRGVTTGSSVGKPKNETKVFKAVFKDVIK